MRRADPDAAAPPVWLTRRGARPHTLGVSRGARGVIIYARGGLQPVHSRDGRRGTVPHPARTGHHSGRTAQDPRAPGGRASVKHGHRRAVFSVAQRPPVAGPRTLRHARLQPARAAISPAHVPAQNPATRARPHAKSRRCAPAGSPAEFNPSRCASDLEDHRYAQGIRSLRSKRSWTPRRPVARLRDVPLLHQRERSYASSTLAAPRAGLVRHHLLQHATKLATQAPSGTLEERCSVVTLPRPFPRAARRQANLAGNCDAPARPPAGTAGPQSSPGSDTSHPSVASPGEHNLKSGGETGCGQVDQLDHLLERESGGAAPPAPAPFTRHPAAPPPSARR